MTFTMDNGLFSALFRLDCVIVEWQDKLTPLQWNIYAGASFSTAAGDHSGCLREVATAIAVFVMPIA
jgi:hypothetical protein